MQVYVHVDGNGFVNQHVDHKRSLDQACWKMLREALDPDTGWVSDDGHR